MHIGPDAAADSSMQRINATRADKTTFHDHDHAEDNAYIFRFCIHLDLVYKSKSRFSFVDRVLDVAL